jgi:hypothetical protein
VGEVDARPGEAPPQRPRLRHRESQAPVKSVEAPWAWEALGVDSFDRLCRAESSLDSETVGLVLEAQSGTTLRAVLGARGRPKKGEDKRCDSHLSRGTGNREYTVARLRRDGFENLVGKVEPGEPGARAAAIEAGIIEVPTADPMSSSHAATTVALPTHP